MNQGEPLSDLVQRLRDAAEAYPEDLFTPLTAEERKQHIDVLDRISASMGRHMAKVWLLPAADRIESLEARNRELETENTCDVCGGTGEVAEPPCMCAGTGKMSQAAMQLRIECFDYKTRIEDLEARLRRSEARVMELERERLP